MSRGAVTCPLDAESLELRTAWLPAGLLIVLPLACPVATSRGCASFVCAVLADWSLVPLDCATAITDKHANPAIRIFLFIVSPCVQVDRVSTRPGGDGECPAAFP